MKKGLFIFVFGIILLSGFVLALPQDPCAFYGKITYNGTSIPDGYEISAKIGNVLKEKGDIIFGEYGIKDLYGMNNSFIVLGSAGDTIEFFIGEEKIAEHDFQAKRIFKFDIDLSFLPEKPNCSVSDDICNVSAGECSTNAVDCSPLVTDVCEGNGRCDIEIGEDCLTAPQDCGECETEETPNNNNNNGNSGGGGGGGGSTPTTNLNTESDGNTQESNDEPLVLTIEELNQKENQKQGFFKATGSAISDFSKTTGGKILIVVLSLVILGLVLVLVKKKLKK